MATTFDPYGQPVAPAVPPPGYSTAPSSTSARATGVPANQGGLGVGLATTQPRTFVNPPGVNTMPPGRPEAVQHSQYGVHGQGAAPSVFGESAPSNITTPPPPPTAAAPTATTPSSNPTVTPPAPAVMPPTAPPAFGGYQGPSRFGHAVPMEPLPPNPGYSPGTREFRQYQAEKNAVVDRNMANGYSLADMGKENSKEHGQSAFSTMQAQDYYGPAWQEGEVYDLQNGTMSVYGNRGPGGSGPTHSYGDAPIPPDKLAAFQQWRGWVESPEGKGWAQAYGGSPYQGWLVKQDIEKEVAHGNLDRYPGASGGYTDYGPDGRLRTYFDQYGHVVQPPADVPLQVAMDGNGHPIWGQAPGTAPAAPAAPGTAGAPAAAPAAAPVPAPGAPQQPPADPNAANRAPVAQAPGQVPSQAPAAAPAPGTVDTRPPTQLGPNAPGQVPAAAPAPVQAATAAPPAPTTPSVTLERAPTSSDLSTLRPGVPLVTPVGTFIKEATSGRVLVTLSPQGQQALRTAHARAHAAFGAVPLGNDPRAPRAPIVPGAYNYNPFTGKFTR